MKIAWYQHLFCWMTGLPLGLVSETWGLALFGVALQYCVAVPITNHEIRRRRDLRVKGRIRKSLLDDLGRSEAVGFFPQGVDDATARKDC